MNIIGAIYSETNGDGPFEKKWRAEKCIKICSNVQFGSL
jgi:hypothetical protein